MHVAPNADRFEVEQLPGYWREHHARAALDAWRASRLSLAAFARQHGIHVAKLRRWHRRLESGDAATAPRFVRLTIAGPEARGASVDPFRVHVGDFTVEVPADFQELALARLLRVLSC